MADSPLRQPNPGFQPSTIAASGAMPISKSAQTLYGHFTEL